MNRNISQLVEDWYSRAGVSQKAHQMSADANDRRNRWLGVPAIVLSAVVGSSVFSSIGSDTQLWQQIAIGTASIAAAVLAGLQTFMSYAERAEKHRIAAAKYGAVCRELDVIRVQPDSTPKDLLEDLRRRLDVLALESPNPPIRIYRSAWANWEKWEKS